MFFNEGLSRWAGHVQLPQSGAYLFLDLIADIRERGETDDGSIALELEPYQSCVLVFTEGLGSFPQRRPFDSDQTVPVTGPWEIATATAREYPDFTVLKRSSELFNVTGAEALPNFSGFMRYTAAFAFPHAASGEWVLNLSTVGETARVWLNGRMLGVRICPPYRFVLPGDVLQRHNRLEIEVANTLAFQVKDWVSSFVLLPPSGLLGPVTLSRRR